MWQFKKLSPGDPERDPEFFRLNAPAEAVVREFIQNSLDAKLLGNHPIKVRFFFGEADPSRIASYLNNLKDHLKASGIRFEYDGTAHVPFLLLEDFGTAGLDGDTGENGNRPTGRSNFYNFWWCEGKSKKSGRETGRWGLGKTTFHLVSKIRSFFGLTVRNDDKRTLLMGKSVMKTHRIGNDVYHYYGYYTADNKYNPLSDEQSIREFKEGFHISRNYESGLSILIPFPDDEIDFSSILKSIIVHYFFAI